ncbi:class I SAM-dependent methyltransferase [Paenibacillus caui]|uniref:class I SAM-dependent methyltransferase n=1 Tax=Paenibacillus caui TaxID=2873927 RepID=UPI001CA9F4C2|nr:class I SAM-dependent methyltransferase [Paenibacillus caui]
MKYADMIALTGEGAAHPGGFEGTVRLLKAFPFPQGSTILEVGCGTGRTACYLAELGYSVTALDHNPRMLAKARARARVEQADVRFVEGDLAYLPFEDNTFDYVFAESVTLFVDPDAAFSEYARVLAPGGRLFDRELFGKRKNRKLENKMRELYGIHSLPLIGDWVERLRAAGLTHPQVWADEGRAQPLPGTQDAIPWGDPNQILDVSRLMDPEVTDFMEQNQSFISQYGTELSYAVLIGSKPAG